MAFLNRRNMRRRQLLRSYRRMIAWGIRLISIGGLVGCTQVEPGPDYQDAASRVGKRLGIAEVYEPAIEPDIEQKVQALLADGLTADEAISVSLLNNRNFQSLFQSIGVSRADVVQSGLWTNPSLFIGNRFIEGGGRTELTFGFAQNLVDLWQIPVKKRIAEAQLKQTVLVILDEAVRLATSTRSRYYDYLWRERLSKIATDNVSRAERSLRIAQARLDAGDTSPLDAGLVRTQVLQARNAALGAQRDLENARLNLLQNLGLARWERDVQLADSFADPRIQLAPNDELVATALNNRFDVQIADARVEAAAQDVDLQLRKVWPNVTIGVQGERTEQRAMPGRKILADTARASIAAGQPTAPSIQSRNQRDIARSQIIDALFGMNIQLTLPIWDQNQAQIAKAGFAYQQNLKDREYLLDTLVTEIRQAANNVRIATRQFDMFEDALLPQAESNIQTAQRRYENGEDSVLVLLEAQDAMFVQKRQAADALRELLVSRAELSRVCGGRLPNDGEGAVRQIDPSREPAGVADE